jgi:hypothetical protein
MPFKNILIPDLSNFVPGADFDPDKDRLVLITTAGERLVVQYETHRDRYTGKPEHGEQHYWIDELRVPRNVRATWPGRVGPDISDGYGGIYVTVHPTYGQLMLTVASSSAWGCLESVHKLESIVQQRRPRRSRISVTNVSYLVRPSVSDAAVFDAVGAVAEQRMAKQDGFDATN